MPDFFMMNKRLTDELTALLGAENVLLPGEGLNLNLQNTTHFSFPDVPALVRPANPEELSALLALCRREKQEVYTFSKGLNWGLGSKLPVQPGCLLVELSRMNQILEINEEFHYAIVEPGVSQGQLSEEIRRRGLKVMLNVTGSSPDASVMANMLERGSGFFAHRIEDLKGVEVMLADGSLYRSGFWDERGSKEVFHYPIGMGPEWKGLFAQSNLGVVTKVVVNLHPKLEVQKMLWCKVPEENLPGLVEGLGELYRRKYLVAVTHIGNDKRMKIEHRGADQQSTWTSFGMVQGSASFMEFLEKEIPALIGNRCQSLGFYSEEEANAAGIGTVFGCNSGIPTDYFLRAMYRSEDLNPEEHDLQIDHGPLGMLCCLPVLPLEASAITACLEILSSIHRDFGMQPATTLNPLNDQCLESVINLYFDRNNPEEVEKAHQANLEMSRRFYEAGFRFYRLDVKLMKEFILPSNPHWKLVRQLKNTLDPDGILSPGRYSI
jgi:4-cresol dehydrogenase (hydroxylating)